MPIVAVALLLEAFLALRRRWRDLLLVALGLAVEITVFLVVNELVRRARPSVPKLGLEPSTYSFPSGHIAATLVLYGSVVPVLVVIEFARRRRARVLRRAARRVSSRIRAVFTEACITPAM